MTIKYRDGTQIKASILKVISEAEDRRNLETHNNRSIIFIIYKKLKLSCHQIRMHLSELYCDGLIDKYRPLVRRLSRGRKHTAKSWSYRVTEKGRQFLDKYLQLISFLMVLH